MQRSVAVLVASLRQDSLNAKLADVLEAVAGDRLSFDRVDMNLPLYDDDLWSDPPAPVTRMKDQIAAADGVLILTPEYNRTYPGLLGNVFDWGSRPYGKGVWAGKPVAFGGATRGSVGTAAAQQHVRLAVSNLRMLPMPAAELYIAWTPERFGDDGTVKAEDTRKVLETFVDGFAHWIERTAPKKG